MSHSAIERRRRAALAMIQRGIHDDETAAAQAMDRSPRTYYYIKSSPEWLALRDRLRDRIQYYAWVEWQKAVDEGNLDRAGDICYTFDLIGHKDLRKHLLEAGIDKDWW